MLRSTFVHLPGISLRSERKLWEEGILCWQDFLRVKKVNNIGLKRKIMLDSEIKRSIAAHVQGDEKYFASCLPRAEHWRAYRYFLDESLCLDIEWDRYGVTVLTICNGVESKVLVRGVNLFREKIIQALYGCKLLLTFNGGVDLHHLKKEFDVDWQGLHCDIRTVAARLGYSGGLKHIEKEMGIKRKQVITSGDPALLYRMWRGSGDRHYLKLLLDYNEADALHLYYLMQKLIGKIEKQVQ